MQLDTRRSKYTELVKVLQNEKNLAVEENKLLNKQVLVKICRLRHCKTSFCGRNSKKIVW
jgi:hypothetical protein